MTKWQWFMSKGQMWIGVIGIIASILSLVQGMQIIRAIFIFVLSIVILQRGRKNVAKYRTSACKVGG